MNAVVSLMVREMRELELGLSGALNISDSMDTLITNLYTNKVPPAWLKVCGQIGPTGTYNRKPLGLWFVDLLARHRQLLRWSEEPGTLPPCVWIAGLFNPMGYVTACLQVTARAKGLPLDSMVIATEMLSIFQDAVEAQPSEGTYIHGLYMEGARWDPVANSMSESEPKVRAAARSAQAARSEPDPRSTTQQGDDSSRPRACSQPSALALLSVPRLRPCVHRSSFRRCRSSMCVGSRRMRSRTTAPTSAPSTRRASAGRRSRLQRRCAH